MNFDIEVIKLKDGKIIWSSEGRRTLPRDWERAQGFEDGYYAVASACEPSKAWGWLGPYASEPEASQAVIEDYEEFLRENPE